ncbi:MAG: preprotein translocase subunit SecY [bacterium]|jgi:preprotein translocase subunit SecY
MLETFKNIFKLEELRNRVLFTLGMLIVFRIGAHIPTPGVNSNALAEFFQQQTQEGSVLAFFNMFSGGALSRLSVFALGIMPYISSSIIVQLLTAVFPYFERLQKEGDAGRKKITQYTRYGTIVIAVIQSFGMSVGILNMNSPKTGASIVLAGMPSWGFQILTVITFTAGTAFIMWVGEQISERGIGNGISLIIFAGIITDIPSATINTLQLIKTGQFDILKLVVILAVMLLVIAAVIFIETANRKIPVQYARRTQGNRVYGGQSSHLPLKINASGVIPPIFASSLLAFPATITGFINVPWVKSIGSQLSPGALLYNIVFVLMIFFFCFFYTAIQFNPVKIADDMKRYGGYIPGIRPGKRTADYVNLVLSRLTFGGAIYLSIICILPSILYNFMKVPFSFGGTALLIVVGVALDTTTQMETFLLNQSYDGFMRKRKRKKY